MRTSLLLASAVLVSIQSFAQVKFNLVAKEGQSVFEVVAVSEKSYDFPQNMVATAQVTVRVKTGADFDVKEIEGGVSSARWSLNSVVDNHPASPGFTYYSFGLESMGVKEYIFEKEKPTVLFRFKNAGNNSDGLTLISDNDPMVKKAMETKINLGNQINILGFERGIANAYVGNVLGAEPTLAEVFTKMLSIESIFPNPASSVAKIRFQNNFRNATDKLLLEVVQVGTSLVIEKHELPTAFGVYDFPLNVKKLKEGMYLVRLVRNDSAEAEAMRLFVTK